MKLSDLELVDQQVVKKERQIQEIIDQDRQLPKEKRIGCGFSFGLVKIQGQRQYLVKLKKQRPRLTKKFFRAEIRRINQLLESKTARIDPKIPFLLKGQRELIQGILADHRFFPKKSYAPRPSTLKKDQLHIVQKQLRSLTIPQTPIYARIEAQLTQKILQDQVCKIQLELTMLQSQKTVPSTIQQIQQKQILQLTARINTRMQLREKIVFDIQHYHFNTYAEELEIFQITKHLDMLAIELLEITQKIEIEERKHHQHLIYQRTKQQLLNEINTIETQIQEKQRRNCTSGLLELFQQKNELHWKLQSLMQDHLS